MKLSHLFLVAGSGRPDPCGECRVKPRTAGRWLVALTLMLATLPAAAQIQRSFRNLGFEAPPTIDVQPNCFMITRAQDVPGWVTSETNQTNSFPGPPCTNGNPGTGAGTIEIWNSSFEGVTAAQGSQFAELNAWSNGRLSQQVCLFNNERVGYSMLHRGRGDATVSYVAEFNIDNSNNSIFRASTTSAGVGGTSACGGTTFATPQTSDQTGTTDGLVQSASCKTSASTSGWRRYNGTFVYGGTNGTHNFGFAAINGGTVGNFLDDVDILLSPVVEFTGTIAGTRREGATPNTISPQIRIVGTVPAGGLVLDFENANTATATQGTDYTINSVTIPAGRYETPTTITLTNLITINNDTVIENNETIDLRIVARQGDYVVGSTQTCGNDAATPGVVTIIDNDVDLATTKTVDNASPVPGGNAVFTVTYQNNTARPTVGTGTDLNAHDATATLADALPAGFTAFAWTCAATGSATCPAANGTGAINVASVNLPAGSGAAGGTLTYTVTGTLDAARCDAINNTSTISLTSGAAVAEGTGAQDGFVTPTPGGTANNTATRAVDPGCLTLSKTTQGAAGGPFGFNLTNTARATGSVTTTAAGTPQQVDGNAAAGMQPFGVSAAATAITIAEASIPANFALASAQCTSAGATVGALGGATYTIPASAVVAGADFVCTFVNGRPPRITLTKISNGDTGTFNFSGTNGFANQSITTASAGGTGTSGAQQTLTAGSTATTITEAATTGFVLTSIACTGLGTGGTATADLAARSVTLDAAATAANSDIACTFTNQRQTSLQLAKAWAAGSIAGDQVTIGATTGGANNTASFNATAPNAADSGTAVVVDVGDVVTLPAETGADLANYVTTVACTGNHTLSGTDGQQSNTLTLVNGNPAVCTYTNTPRTTTLQLAKAWADGSTAGDQVTIGATTGGTNNTASFDATAPAAATGGTAVTVTVGNTITLPAETGTDVANFTTTVACTGGHTLSGTDGQQSNTLTITSTNPTVCTYTNTPRTTTMQLAKAWADGSIAGNQVTIGATTGGANNTASFNATAPTAATSGTAVTVNVGNAITLPAETGTDAANYTTTVACTGDHTLSGTDGQQSNTLTITSTNPTVCTYTNTPRTTTLQLAKAWADGSTAGNRVTIGATTGGTNNTASFDATAPTAATSGTAVIVTVGNTITLPAETGTDVANFTTTVACTGGHTLSGTDGQQSNTLTITSTNPTVCTYTNTPIGHRLTLRKQWSGAAVGDDATITASRGGAAFATFASNADSADELDTDATTANVFAGETVTLAETLAAGNGGQYDSALACTGAADADPGDGLTIAAGDGDIVCTFTNTQRATDLSITKTNTPNSGASDQTGDTVVAGADTTYSVVVTNHAAAAVTGAVVRDTPQAGLNCPTTNPVTCTGAACPSGNLTVGDLSNGVTLGTLAAGGTATFSFTCVVQ